MDFLRRAIGRGQPVETWPSSEPITRWPGDEWDLNNEALYVISGPLRARLDVVGESRHQDALERIAGGRTRYGLRDPDGRHVALLIPTDEGEGSPATVRVYIAPSGPAHRPRIVGTLSANDAATYRPVIDQLATYGRVTACRASLVGGWDKGDGNVGSFGVILHLDGVERCRAEVAKKPPTATWSHASLV